MSLLARIFSRLFLVSVFATSTQVVAAGKAIDVIAYKVSSKPVQQSLRALGSLKAKDSVNIAASVSEVLKALHFKDGQMVRKSQLLVELNAQEQLALLEEAKEVAEEANRQYKRVKEVEGRGNVTKAMVDQYYSDWKAAIAKRKVIEAQVADRRLYAPFAGQVGFHQFSVGAYVSAGATIVSLEDTSQMKVELLLPSRYLKDLKVGQPVQLTTASYPNRIFKGAIFAIAPRLQSNLRMVQVQARVPNTDSRLKTNMLVEAHLLLPPQKQLRIPSSAILAIGDHQYVYRLKPGKVEGSYKTQRVEIQTGERGFKQTQVLKGITPGDVIVSQGIMSLRPGKAVKIKVMQTDQPQSELLESQKKSGKKPSDTAVVK
ncbi:efflux RND transporter periplasmic adaptor subunit [Hydrogenovibrio kuenenii]|uniref:efflux RND transporter periplasmic adaptor subunit n=1 Tax=Hydrogenovibrio kuenenii TaxID=63658 RepID=UPI00046699CF|nr:efflux RND transporter periplasmic adaptor subunit [Hydrogenovibrio kuenenii]